MYQDEGYFLMVEVLVKQPYAYNINTNIVIMPKREIYKQYSFKTHQCRASIKASIIVLPESGPEDCLTWPSVKEMCWVICEKAAVVGFYISAIGPVKMTFLGNWKCFFFSSQNFG